MAIMVASARSDERGKLSGGKAGDQKQVSGTNDTKGEVSMQPFYVHSKGWYILRPKNVAYAERIASLGIVAANNSNIGYNQADRLGVVKYGINTKVKTNADCSSLVRQVVKEATGKDPGNFTTSNEAAVLMATGLFEKISYVNEKQTPVYNGDILVTKTKGHTVMVVSGNPRRVLITKKEEYDMKTIRKGSKGKAVMVWQIIIGSDADGDFGSNTEKRTREWQKANGLQVDGVVGEKSWKKGLESL